MSQVTSPEVPSGSGLSVRQMINAVLAALMSSNSGSSEPPNPVAGQVWFDTTSGRHKRRNAANTAWQEIVDSNLIGALIAEIPFGAVGSHVVASCTILNVAEGTEVLGSTLRPTGAFTALWIFNTPQSYNGTNGAALAGKWRCMGRIWSYADGSTTNVSTATLFVRIE